jgi:type IV secretory pathway VirB2 component (pilin)
MTDSYCRTCYRTLPPGRETCAACERQVSEGPASRVMWVLAVIAAALMITGMLSYNFLLCAIGAVVAVAGVLLRLAKL